MERFYTHLEQTLIDMEFLDPAAPRQLMSRLRRLYGRVRLDEMELNILRGILTETQKWVRGAARRQVAGPYYLIKIVGFIVDQFSRLLHT